MRTFPFFRNFFLVPALDALLVDTPAEDAALTTLQTVLKVAAGAPASEAGLGNTVQFTGFTVGKGDGVEAALSNIYMEQQLVVFYLAKADVTDPNGHGEVEVGFSATGRWRVEVEGVIARFQRAYIEIVDVAAEAAAQGLPEVDTIWGI